MIMNTQQLQYLVEIERTRSISQAAANLYMGQPNLSRVLRDIENSLGFTIFERTRKGVRPTEKGTQFLQHAKNILREATFMEQLGPNCAQPNRFRICLPRSYVYVDLIQKFLRSHVTDKGLDALIRECHPHQAIEFLENGTVEIAVIRYGAEYHDFFLEQAQAKNLTMQILSQSKYEILLSRKNPLTRLSTLSAGHLDGYTELVHRDSFFCTASPDKTLRQLYTVDRLAQVQLLQTIPNSYMWSELLPATILEAMQLSQHPYENGGTLYQNALLFKPQCAMSPIEKSFLQWITEKHHSL